MSKEEVHMPYQNHSPAADWGFPLLLAWWSPPHVTDSGWTVEQRLCRCNPRHKEGSTLIACKSNYIYTFSLWYLHVKAKHTPGLEEADRSREILRVMWWRCRQLHGSPQAGRPHLCQTVHNILSLACITGPTSYVVQPQLTWAKSHFNLNKSLIAVRQQVLGFSVVDPHYAQK